MARRLLKGPRAMSVMLLSTAALLLASTAAPPGPPRQGLLATDPLLARLVEESLAARPELKQARATADAARERIPQAGALPDPMLTLGIQNDGFDGIQIGRMPGSFWQVMVTQPLPWPGKRGLREEIATTGAREAEARTARARLSVVADVERAWLDLLLVRDRLALLDRLDGLWVRAEGLARSRYEAGEGSQADLLRSQLERNRLRQRRWGLQAEERTWLQALNRLRDRPLDEPIPTSSSLADLPLPTLPASGEAVADAEARSPELLLARLEAERAGQALRLAERDRFPDLAVSAGVMPRGGLDPMWQAGVSVTLPVFAGRKQARAVAERAAEAQASGSGAAAVAQVLRQRVVDRLALLESLVETARIYREGLIIQSRATAESTISQYRVGRVSFASVLDALGGVIADEDGWLQANAAAQRVAIAAQEVSLEPAGAGGGGGLSGAAMPGAGAMGTGAPGGAGASSTGPM
jgi:outer membrane protein TolC